MADAIRWTFWPSLALAVALLTLGRPILALFGQGFVDGYPLIFVMTVGLLARASVGPAERLLNMVGQQNVCAAIYCTAFAVNLTLCVILIPHFGLFGAAIATATAVVAGIGFAVRRHQAPAWTSCIRLGRSRRDMTMLAPAQDNLITERRSLAALGDIVEEWRRLADNAAEPNIFYDPDFALAAAPALGRHVEVILVWSADAARRLVGLFPVMIAPRRYLVRLPVLVGWTHPFASLGTPLIDCKVGAAVAVAFLDHVAGRRRSAETLAVAPATRRRPSRHNARLCPVTPQGRQRAVRSPSPRLAQARQ